MHSKSRLATAARWAGLWGFPVPQTPGWTAPEMVEHSARGEVDLFWMVGGNFLETLADADRSRAALRRPRLRIHQDVVLSSSMLVDGDGDVLVLLATTRYESPAEGCGRPPSDASFARDSGRRIGSARPEWWVFREVMTRIDPERANLVGMSDAAAIRGEIARAIPLYAGIETLSRKGDQVQWGGRTLYADGRFATRTDGRTLRPRRSAEPRAPETFLVSTRRGKQFNSMIQRDFDPLTGAHRDSVLMSAADMTRLQLEDGAAVRRARRTARSKGG